MYYNKIKIVTNKWIVIAIHPEKKTEYIVSKQVIAFFYCKAILNNSIAKRQIESPKSLRIVKVIAIVFSCKRFNRKLIYKDIFGGLVKNIRF